MTRHAQMANGVPGFDARSSPAANIDFWIYRFDQELTAAVRDRCGLLLTDEERDRIARFHTQERRDQALIARALSRRALARRFGGAPHDWRFSATDRGRPFVSGKENAIDFNLSHAAGCVVCAVAAGARVGVDVEPIARAGDINEVSARVFSERERRRLKDLMSCGVADAPVRLWTVKEAYAKALGLGLGLDFRTLEFVFDAGFSDLSLMSGDGSWRFHSAVAQGVAYSLALQSGGENPVIISRDAACLL